MINFTDKELNRRLTTLHPEARREWARLTDNRTYRGPHNICKGEDEPFRLLGISERVWFAAAGLAFVCWAAMTFQGV